MATTSSKGFSKDEDRQKNLAVVGASIITVLSPATPTPEPTILPTQTPTPTAGPDGVTTDTDDGDQTNTVEPPEESGIALWIIGAFVVLVIILGVSYFILRRR